MAFSLKNIVEPAMLNGSIKAEKEEKSRIFAKAQGRAVSGYYALSAISMILSGFLYEINGYIPLLLSLGIVIITLIISTRFEDVKIEEKNEDNVETVSLKEAIKFVFKAKNLSNFTNSKIDTKIFAIYNFCRSLLNVLFGIFASILIDKVNISEAMMIFGITSLAIVSFVLTYMKNKVGLDPKEYSEIELKYDEKI